MKFFIYSRKSVYTGKGESIDNQIEMCRQYIAAKFPNTTADITVYEDEGFSAKNTDRPRFQQMLRDLKQVQPDFVVCYRLDRVSRSVSDFSALIEELNDRSIAFICIKEEFDTSKPMGKAMMYIASVFAQLERETIAERVRDNMLMLARTGRWLGGTTPTGYTAHRRQELLIDGKLKTACILLEEPCELTAVDAIFANFLELRSISAVSKRLIQQNICSRSGRPYSLPGIKEILQNPVYCTADYDALQYFTAHHAEVCFDAQDCSNEYGLLAYNKRDYTKKHAPRQSMDKWIVAIGQHKGRISGKKWVAIQTLLADNRPTGTKPAKMHNDYALLSGLIYCGQCGSRMFAKPRSNPSAAPYRFDYICSSKLRGTQSCTCQNIAGLQTDALVCQHLLPYMIESTAICSLLEKLKRTLPDDHNPHLAAQIQKCSSEQTNLITALSQSDLSAAFIRQVNVRIAELEVTRSELAAQQEQLQQSACSLTDAETAITQMASRLSNLKALFPMLPIYDKRALIKLLVSKLPWDGQTLHIDLAVH